MKEKLETLSTPPEELSIYENVKKRWDEILGLWRKGWAAESKVERLEDYIEYHRVKIFEEKTVNSLYDWESDWLRAVSYHDHQHDFVLNRKKFNEDLKQFWGEWHERSIANMNQLAFEALRGMILVNGATILACLTLLSGQIENPVPSAVLAAKVMVFSAILSLLLMVLGHTLAFARIDEVEGKVHGVLVGIAKHGKLYAISRYLRRYLDPIIKISSALIYGSIFVFAFSAFVSTLILIFSNPL